MSGQTKEDIRKTIKKSGICLFAISDAIECEECGDTPCGAHAYATYTDLDAGFVYSVGHWERKRPELIVLCGPTPMDAHPMNREALIDTMTEAAHLINHLVENWTDNPVLPGHRCQDANGRVYMVDDGVHGVALAKKGMTHAATDYYGSEHYALMVLIPLYQTAPANKLH